MGEVVFALNHLYLLQSALSPLRSLRCDTQFPVVFLDLAAPMIRLHGDRIARRATALMALSCCLWTVFFSETGHR